MSKIDLNNLQYKSKPIISREIILSNISEYDIYRKYIGYDFALRKPFESPFREDSIPSFGIFRNSSGNLIYNDFVLGGGDVFTFVKYLFQFKTWWEVYSRIAIDFWIHEDYICKKEMLTTGEPSKIEYYEKTKLQDNPIEIDVKLRDFNKDDKKYWMKYGLSLRTLKKYKVCPISHVFFISNGKQKILKADKHAYAYIEKKDGKYTYKIYQPFSKYKWLNNHNNSVWQGWTQLPLKGDVLVITKSLKDVMCITKHLKVASVALQSEKIMPKKNVIAELKDRFKYIFILYDNDYDKSKNWGQLFARKISNTFGIPNICISEHYKSKDFSDMIVNIGIEESIDILHKIINRKKHNYLPF